MENSSTNEEIGVAEHLPVYIYILSAIIPLLSLILVINYLRKDYKRYIKRIRVLLLMAVVEPIILLFTVLIILNALGL